MFVHLKSIFFAPTFKGDEAKTRAVGQIHVIVLVMSASALLYTVIFPFANPAQAYRLYLIVPLYPLLLGVLFLVRHGWVRLSTTLLLGGVWLILIYSAAMSGGVRAPAYGGFIVVVLAAGILLGQSAAFGVGTTSLAIGEEHFFQTVKVPLVRTDGSVQVLGISTDITERRRAEEELGKLSRAVEQSPVSIVITDTAGNIDYVNPKFTEVTGYSREEMLGRNPRILKSGETPLADYKQLWDTITGGREWRGEFHNRKKNGELYWERASISPITNQAGVITHFLAVKEDITESKRAEVELEQSEERFSKIFNASPIPITLSRIADGTYIAANNSYLRLSGFTGEEVIGHTILELGIYPNPEMRSILLKTLRERGRIENYDQPFRTKSGTIIDTALWIEPISINSEAYALALALNTTERKWAEEELRASEASLKFSQQVAHVGHWTWDMSTNKSLCPTKCIAFLDLNPPRSKRISRKSFCRPLIRTIWRGQSAPSTRC